MTKKLIIKETKKEGNIMNEFYNEVSKINDTSTKEYLLELYKKDETKAWLEYKRFIALTIVNNNKNLFKRLSKL